MRSERKIDTSIRDTNRDCKSSCVYTKKCSILFIYIFIYTNSTIPLMSKTISLCNPFSMNGEYDETNCRPSSAGCRAGSCAGSNVAVWLLTGGRISGRSVIGARGRSGPIFNITFEIICTKNSYQGNRLLSSNSLSMFALSWPRTAQPSRCSCHRRSSQQTRTCHCQSIEPQVRKIFCIEVNKSCTNRSDDYLSMFATPEMFSE